MLLSRRSMHVVECLVPLIQRPLAVAHTHLNTVGVLIMRHEDLRRQQNPIFVTEDKLEGALLVLGAEAHLQWRTTHFACVRPNESGEGAASGVEVVTRVAHVLREDRQVLSVPVIAVLARVVGSVVPQRERNQRRLQRAHGALEREDLHAHVGRRLGAAQVERHARLADQHRRAALGQGFALPHQLPQVAIDRPLRRRGAEDGDAGHEVDRPPRPEGLEHQREAVVPVRRDADALPAEERLAPLFRQTVRRLDQLVWHLCRVDAVQVEVQLGEEEIGVDIAALHGVEHRQDLLPQRDHVVGGEVDGRAVRLLAEVIGHEQRGLGGAALWGQSVHTVCLPHALYAVRPRARASRIEPHLASRDEDGRVSRRLDAEAGA
mmetsp:Transcript_47826/g.118430  ORF Transcript_47826/g.118430 Transcript_47826/m.118430 type:complete len:377 (+) Transcript_47826:614-1744(+)